MSHKNGTGTGWLFESARKPVKRRSILVLVVLNMLFCWWLTERLDTLMEYKGQVLEHRWVEGDTNICIYTSRVLNEKHEVWSGRHKLAVKEIRN
ncbi:MAG: hypothetical protein V3T77_11280 [Planctomycetota bacterium]